MARYLTTVLACLQHEKFQSAPGSRVGTPAYLAPEVIMTTKGQTYDGKVSCPLQEFSQWNELVLPLRKYFCLADSPWQTGLV